MKVWILQTGEPLPVDGLNRRPMRAMNLAAYLERSNNQVTIWSSNFDHFTKSHRFHDLNRIQLSDNLDLRLIDSSGYSSHFGFKRIWDHFQLGINLRKMLRNQEPPDVAFIGYPPIEPAYVMMNWLHRRGVPVVIDVKDAWPEVFIRAIPRRLRFLANLITSPYEFMFKSMLRKAKGISTISPPFLSWCLKKAGRKQQYPDMVAYLSAPFIEPSQSEIAEASVFWDEIGVCKNGSLKFAYIGSLTSIFDFTQIIDAARNGLIELIICGDGPMLETLRMECFGLHNVKFPGWLTFAKIMELANRSDFLLAPYCGEMDFELSLPNKFIDAMALGRPIISSLGGYSKEFITSQNIGYYYSLSDSNSLERIITKIKISPDQNRHMGVNARLLFQKQFSFEKVYGELTETLQKLAFEAKTS